MGAVRAGEGLAPDRCEAAPAVRRISEVSAADDRAAVVALSDCFVGGSGSCPTEASPDL